MDEPTVQNGGRIPDLARLESKNCSAVRSPRGLTTVVEPWPTDYVKDVDPEAVGQEAQDDGSHGRAEDASGLR